MLEKGVLFNLPHDRDVIDRITEGNLAAFTKSVLKSKGWTDILMLPFGLPASNELCNLYNVGHM